MTMENWGYITAKELIDKLANFPDDMKVMVGVFSGSCYEYANSAMVQQSPWDANELVVMIT